MKKILTIAGCLAFAAISQGQGTVEFYSANLGVLTNTSVSQYNGGNQTGGTSGKTSIAPNGFYYQLFVQTYTGSLSSGATNPLTGGWTVATSSGNPIIGTNGVAGPQLGSILGPNGTVGVAVDQIALPTSGSYTSSGEAYFMIAGWSSSLGSTWGGLNGVAAQLNSGNWAANGFFGVSTIGYTYAGGAFSLNAQSLFNANAATQVPVGAFTLFGVSPSAPVPEPSTMALAALGGASLLLFRRRKV